MDPGSCQVLPTRTGPANVNFISACLVQRVSSTDEVVLGLAAEAYQSGSCNSIATSEQKAVRASVSATSAARISHKQYAVNARSGSLADADARTVQVLLEAQVVFREPAELELAHRLLPRAIHHAGQRGRSV